MQMRRVILLAWLVTASNQLTMGQGGAPLGPKDGKELSPTELERIGTGSMAPDFSLESKNGTPVTLSDFRGKKNVVLVFYRGHW